MWPLREQLLADVDSPWSSQLSGLKLSKRLLLRITVQHSGCIRHFSIWRWALQVRLQDLLSGSSGIRRFSSTAQERRAARLWLLFSSIISGVVSRTQISRQSYSNGWKQIDEAGFLTVRVILQQD